MPVVGDPARRRAGRSSTSARTSTAGSGSPTSGPAGTDAHPHPRRVARRRTATSPPTTSRPAVPFLPEPLPAGQVDVVVSAGVPGDVFEPRRTTHGFQYVRIEGHPGRADRRRRPRRRRAHRPAAHRLVLLQRRAARPASTRRRCGASADNACDVPTDCPHRERAGWTGDWQLFVPTAAFLYDVAGFSTKWLRDVAADQWPDGTVANISPSARAEGRDEPDRLPQRLGRLGRRRGDRAVGAVPRLRRRAGPRRAVADDGRAGWTAPSGWPATSGTPTRVAPPARAGAARAVPLGHRLPLGRVARARARTSATSAPSSPRTRATSRPPTSRTAPA